MMPPNSNTEVKSRSCRQPRPTKVVAAHALALLVTLLLGSPLSQAQTSAEHVMEPWREAAWQTSTKGHLKYLAQHQERNAGLPTSDNPGNRSSHSLDFRYSMESKSGPWKLALDYQASARYSPETLAPTDGPLDNPHSDTRYWRLSKVISQQSRQLRQHQLDRLYLGYRSEQWVWQLGRQTLSWGNGQLFTPMDIFNPFNPVAIDKSYKSGDDMLYAQRLLQDGSDLQAIWVARHHNTLSSRQSASQALKYHGFTTRGEYDLLLAHHFGRNLLGLGGNFAWGDAIAYGDLVIERSHTTAVASAVIGASYSWMTGSHNTSGAIEFYLNGHGQRSLTPSQLQTSNDETHLLLKSKISRGELFAINRHYLAATATLEVTPLLNASTTLLLNLDHPASLIQVSGRYNWRQDLDLLLAIDLPAGDNHSEYDWQLQRQVSLQLAWYF